MKRIYVELILAILILTWTVGNIVLTGKILFSCFPIVISFCIQFIVLLAVATAEGDESGN